MSVKVIILLAGLALFVALLGALSKRILRFCLENKLVVALLLVVIVGAGIMTAPFDVPLNVPRMPVAVDAIPDVGENQQIVFTEWMGRSPQDVEDQITYPLTVSLLGIPGVKTIRSYSYFGFSEVMIIFREQVDFYWSRSRVLEKLSSLPPETLPEGVQPTLGPDATGLGQVYWYTLEGRDPQGKPAGGWDLHELRSIQDWYVRYALASAEGISEVASVGGFIQEYQIDVDPDAMRAYGVGLDDIFMAVRMSNVDVGARTIEINKVEYVIRGLGFIKKLEDIEQSVIKAVSNVPVTIKDVATVTLGPAMRRGALDKGGAEAVGGVAVVRYGYNPLEAIRNVKQKINDIAAGLPTKAVVDYRKTTRGQVAAFATGHGFEAFASPELNQKDWLKWLNSHRDQWPDWITTSQVTIVPFYDRAGLIQETLGTLKTALWEEILVTVIVVIVMVLHLRSSLLISALLPLAVLMCFIAMRVFSVDANIVALSGIAIAIGTMVDMGIIICENILRHLDEAPPEENRLEVIFRASSEVGGAVVTAVSTTVVGFLPVFFMTGAEGKLFRPLAFTKTFALIASIIVALTIIPPAAHLLFAGQSRLRLLKRIIHSIPGRIRRIAPWLANAAAVVFVGVLLTRHWEPLGPERGMLRNLVFVAALIGGLLALFHVFQRFLYVPILRWCLDHKLLFLSIPLAIVLVGFFAWLGPQAVFGPPAKETAVTAAAFRAHDDFDKLVGAGLIAKSTASPERTVWATSGMSIPSFLSAIRKAEVREPAQVLDRWLKTQPLEELAAHEWSSAKDPGRLGIAQMNLAVKARWTLARGWGGFGKEFMPPLDEGSFLWMPSTMPHASIGEALQILQMQDKLIASVPEIESVVGKLGRVDSPLDPAPISMFETVVNYRPEYVTDKDGRRINYRYDEQRNEFVRNEKGLLIPDPNGMPYRQWRDHIKSPDDIWDEIVKVAELPGTTSAPKLQPIETRIVMLQTGMRAPMGVKVMGPDLETIERVGLEIERFLKEVPSVQADAVIADRIVGKPYLEIDIDRNAIARYGLNIRQVQDVIEVAIGGRRITTTVEGRERYPVRVRYLRELRDQIETLGRILVEAPDGAQIPLVQLAEIRYTRGPQMIKSENTRLVGYVTFDKKPGFAEVDVVEDCERYLQEKIDSGALSLPAGVSYTFSGSYENQIRAQRTLSVVLPLALLTIFLILYFQFHSVPTTLLVFSGVFVAWSGGFLLIWLYAQPWFLKFDVFGVGMRELFQVHPINLSVAIWVGFLALFGIATDDGVVIATYLDQSFGKHKIARVADARAATVEAGRRRVRPCLMTVATTILALIPVLTSTGRGSDIMVPMAIPSFGGMIIVLITMFTVPVMYCAIKEFKLRAGIEDALFAEGVVPGRGSQ